MPPLANTGIGRYSDDTNVKFDPKYSKYPEYYKGPLQDRQRTSQKHIHPCVCDLEPDVKRRIRDRRNKIQEARGRFQVRLAAFEEELRLREEERLKKEQEQKDMEELYQDQYSMVGRKRTRKKRSARRMSMVSLGIKTVINWRKEVSIKENKTSELRKQFGTTYCNERYIPLPLIKNIPIPSTPKIPVRSNRAIQLRKDENLRKFNEMLRRLELEAQKNKVPFVVPVLPVEEHLSYIIEC